MSQTLIAQSGGFLRDRTGDTGCPSNDGVCLGWMVDHLDRYWDPFLEHIVLTLIPLTIGFAIALSMGLIAHRMKWLITPLTGLTSAIYTIPSISSFLLLLPITGRGNDTAIVALTAYTLVIIFRNVITGLSGVPQAAVDAARGMGLTSRQLLFRVELPLALPEIIAGLRIAAATTVGLAAFAYLAGAGGLGANIDSDIDFRGNVLVCGIILTLLAATLDFIVLSVQRLLTPLEAGGGMILPLASILSTFGDAIGFIFERRPSDAGTVQVGGLGEISHLAGNHFAVSFVAIVVSIAIAVPIGLWLGHLGRAELLAVGVANVGRAVPALAIIGFCVAFLGTGFRNIAFALTLLAIPPILTNTYVGMRQVDPDLVDAARGQGLSGFQVVRQVEWPLALPTIFGGIRISVVTVLATAIISPIAGLDSLGTPIFSEEIYGTEGVIAAAIAVAFLTLTTDAAFAAIQRLVTPKGLKVSARGDRRPRLRPLSIRRVQNP